MNRLAREPSPYLRQHAENPVDWYPWGPEALETAKRDSKPILLSVGYSACHWCHVMAHESFEDPQIAARMNALFVNVKVDREERPDLDQIYQGVVQLMGRGGGWPLTVFLAPDLRPFFGGTYFPAEDRYGMPGFKKLLEALGAAWADRKADIEQQCAAFNDGLAQYVSDGLGGVPTEPVERDVLAAARKLSQILDPVNGGFGGAPKFPNPMNVALLLRGWRHGAKELWEGARLQLEHMARGGIYDQLGGGFHRYSVDAHWRVPHFEKMLYDNAQLLHLYSEAQQIEPSSLWAKVATETSAYVAREMTSPEGAFYAAQDADSEGHEGKFFVWTPDEMRAALSPDEARAALESLGVTPEGTFEKGASVLESHGPLDERIRARLFAARAKRIAPGLDDKVLTSWNGLMIRGLSFAGRVFERPEWIAQAQRAADFLIARVWQDGELFHAFQGGRPRIAGLLEDYGDASLGLVALYQATFEPKYLEAAEAWARRAVAHFWDDEKSAYRTAPKSQQDLLVPAYALHDNAFPSGASTLTDAQVALAALTGRKEHLDQAGRYIRAMRNEALDNPFGYGHLWLAIDSYLDRAAQVTWVGPREEWSQWRASQARTYSPTVAWQGWDPAAPAAGVVQEMMAGKTTVGQTVSAYLCRGFACERPVTDPAELEAMLTRRQG